MLPPHTAKANPPSANQPPITGIMGSWGSDTSSDTRGLLGGIEGEYRSPYQWRGLGPSEETRGAGYEVEDLARQRFEYRTTGF